MPSTPELAAYIGLDWGDQQHAVQMQPAAGGLVDRYELEQRRGAPCLGGPAPAAVQGAARRDCHRTAQRRGDARADAVRVPRPLSGQHP